MTASLAAYNALEAGVKPTQVGCEFWKRGIQRHMDPRENKVTRSPASPVFHVEECACKPGFASQAHFPVSHGGRVAKGVSECPDWPSQRVLDCELAVLNLAARFFFAAQRQNGMCQGVGCDAHSSLRKTP